MIDPMGPNTSSSRTAVPPLRHSARFARIGAIIVKVSRQARRCR